MISRSNSWKFVSRTFRAIRRRGRLPSAATRPVYRCPVCRPVQKGRTRAPGRHLDHRNFEISSENIPTERGPRRGHVDSHTHTYLLQNVSFGQACLKHDSIRFGFSFGLLMSWSVVADALQRPRDRSQQACRSRACRPRVRTPATGRRPTSDVRRAASDVRRAACVQCVSAARDRQPVTQPPRHVPVLPVGRRTRPASLPRGWRTSAVIP